jgi:hypothetical protein
MAPNKPDENDTATIPESRLRQPHQVHLIKYVPPPPEIVLPRKPKEWWRGGNPKRKA